MFELFTRLGTYYDTTYTVSETVYMSYGIEYVFLSTIW